MNNKPQKRKSDGADAFHTSRTTLPESEQSHRAVTLQDEQVRFLYSSLPVSIIISAMLVLILVVIQAPVITSALLFGWSTLIGSILLGRAFLYIDWKRSASVAARSDAHRWLFWFRIGVLSTAIAWGIGGVFLTPSDDLGHKVYVSFILAGLSAGAAASLAIDRISYIGFLCSVLIPQIIFLANQGDRISLSMSIVDALFLLFLLANAHKFNLQLKENFYLRQKAIENESQLHHMLEGSPIAAYITDAVSNQVLFANSSYISLIDSTPEEVTSLVPASYYADTEIYKKIMETLRKGDTITNELIELRSAGDRAWCKWVLASYFPLKYQNKPAILGWLYDITDRKLMEDKIAHMAYHDKLTGLPNRTLFIDRLKQTIADAERENNVPVLMFLDLDRFKPVNDRHGHHIGDLLLKAVADRIRGCLRKSDSVARVGGDEFIILLPSVKTKENGLDIAEKIRQSLSLPFEIAGLSLHISSSIGVAFYLEYTKDEQELIREADIAMYHAKANGGNSVEAYRKAMQTNQEAGSTEEYLSS